MAHNTTKHMFVPTYDCTAAGGILDRQVHLLYLVLLITSGYLTCRRRNLFIVARYICAEASNKTLLLYPAICTLIHPSKNTTRPSASLHTVPCKWNAVSNELQNVCNDYQQNNAWIQAEQMHVRCTCRPSNQQRAALHTRCVLQPLRAYVEIIQGVPDPAHAAAQERLHLLDIFDGREYGREGSK